MGRRRLLVLPVAIVLAPAAAGARVPTTQTCKPAKLPLTFVLPADWSCEGPPPYGNVVAGAKAGGMAPGFVIQLNIFDAKLKADAPIAAYASRLAAGMRAQYARAPDLRVSRVATTVGDSVPAVLIAARFSGNTLQGSTAVLHLDYFFVHGGYLYDFDYGGAAQWMTKDASAIRASARSIRFVARA